MLWTVRLSQVSPLSTYRGISIADNLSWNEHCDAINFVRKQIQLLVFSDESDLLVLRRLRTQLILHLYTPNWSMPVVHGTLTRSVTSIR